jgi:hypothetical protein
LGYEGLGKTMADALQKLVALAQARVAPDNELHAMNTTGKVACAFGAHSFAAGFAERWAYLQSTSLP